LIAKDFPFAKDFHRISGKSFAIMEEGWDTLKATCAIARYA
jgi:hypothetical protein